MKRFFALMLVAACAGTLQAADRPNILWIIADDLSPDLGSYGDRWAQTPHLDRLAAQGARFTRAFTHAPVCAPSRSGLVTGMYPTTIGSHHMRSRLLAPPPLFTRALRDAGYWVCWKGKTDFNFEVPEGSFDSTGDWKEHPAGRPFFAFIHLPEAHESQIRTEQAVFDRVTAAVRPDQRHEPAAAALPPYYPDTPEVRRDWARYYDLGTTVDHRVGEVMAELGRQGIADNTIVFFFGDHGRGLPRAKRWLYDSGTRVPLIVSWPGRISPGTVRDDLVAFIDLAPTVLAVAGVERPARMQGQPFLGPQARTNPYVFAARDRMDETYDRIRSVRDKRYRYIRNFHPDLPYAQNIAYMNKMPTMLAWRRANAEGKLKGAARLFFAARKPAEELYDTDADPHEIQNLAASPQHRVVLQRMRKALDVWIVQTGDLGAVAEQELVRRGLVTKMAGDYEDRRRTGASQ